MDRFLGSVEANFFLIGYQVDQLFILRDVRAVVAYPLYNGLLLLVEDPSVLEPHGFKCIVQVQVLLEGLWLVTSGVSYFIQVHVAFLGTFPEHNV